MDEGVELFILLLLCSSKRIDSDMNYASLQRGVDGKAPRINRYC